MDKFKGCLAHAPHPSALVAIALFGKAAGFVKDDIEPTLSLFYPDVLNLWILVAAFDPRIHGLCIPARTSGTRELIGEGLSMQAEFGAHGDQSLSVSSPILLEMF